jgi:hypothetical protein
MSSNLTSLTQQLGSSIAPAFTSLSAWFSTDPILDQGSNSPFINTTDCRVVGRDIDSSVNIFCSAGIPYIYNLRFIYSAIAVLMLLTCLLVLCLTYPCGGKQEEGTYTPRDEEYFTKGKNGDNVQLMNVGET